MQKHQGAEDQEDVFVQVDGSYRRWGLRVRAGGLEPQIKKGGGAGGLPPLRAEGPRGEIV